MYEGSLAEALFLELLIVSVILILQMLYNNLFIFKKKISDSLSIMLTGCLIMALFDHVWVAYEGREGYMPVCYISAIGYSFALFIFSVYFNRYFVEKLGIKFASKRIEFLVYRLPFIIIALLLVTTPWTHLVFFVNEQNIVEYMPCYDLVFNLFTYAYLISAQIISIYMMIKYGKRNDIYRIARSMIIFVVLALGLYFLQDFVFVMIDDNYISLTLACCVPMVYLTTDLNILTLVNEESKNAAIGADLETARKIQMDALPVNQPAFPSHQEVRLTAFIKTAKEVGGDFYDYFTLDEDRVCFLIADVSGKGIPAALFMMNVKTMIKDHAMSFSSTSEIFTMVNKMICESSKTGMFATAWIGILDTRTMTLQYTNAGHNYPIYSSGSGECVILKEKHGLFLAGMEDTVYKHSELKLGPKDRLLLYTDGITEAHNKNDELYGLERLMESLGNQEGCFTNENMEKMIADVDDFAGGEAQFDDMTMVMVEIA